MKNLVMISVSNLGPRLKQYQQNEETKNALEIYSFDYMLRF